MSENRMCKLLGVRTPIMLAGMGGVSYAKLVAAVSEAGGFGTIGAGTMSPSMLAEEIKKVRELTSKPFGVDILAPFTLNYKKVIQKFAQVVIDGGAKAFITGLGLPSEVVDLCHKNGVLVGCVCGKLSHVKKAVEIGCDFVIVQGTEGGGHTGKLGLMAFLPQAVDLVNGKIPVVAAGGIVDGRGIAASFALGAEAVWIGTKFIATHEAHTVKEFKVKILETQTDDGTTISRGYTGKTCRVIANDYTREFEKNPVVDDFTLQSLKTAQMGINHLGADEDTEGIDINREFFPCGQGVGSIKEILPAKEVMRILETEALSILKTMNTRSKL